MQDLLGLLPGRKRRALVGADDEDRIAEAAAADGVHRERVVVEHDLGREAIEGGLRQAQARVGVCDDRPMGRIRRDEHDEPLDRQLLERRLRQRHVPVVRRVESAAEDPDHWNSSASPATSTSSPRFAPASRSACSSSSSPGGLPTTRNPRSVRRIRNTRRASGRGR